MYLQRVSGRDQCTKLRSGYSSRYAMHVCSLSVLIHMVKEIHGYASKVPGSSNTHFALYR